MTVIIDVVGFKSDPKDAKQKFSCACEIAEVGSRFALHVKLRVKNNRPVTIMRVAVNQKL